MKTTKIEINIQYKKPELYGFDQSNERLERGLSNKLFAVSRKKRIGGRWFEHGIHNVSMCRLISSLDENLFSKR
ncbi:hypothetical protein AKJ52_02905 [candidate division MSBL1 archaeon SCGC-AAA382C18]|uniref:Uncharacterized protein n=1 Tax=candidate division MSBL1 archaeon SCGC-AAA382C18 TaxID=1698281 RepID=A0A133VHF3_9EURY|nr:hypothetical protein AKJ52_02905 [candidate division MSBL1 archaeon SCGC-AAA382C18]